MSKTNNRKTIEKLIKDIRKIKGIKYHLSTGKYSVTLDQGTDSKDGMPEYKVCKKETLANLLEEVDDYAIECIDTAKDEKVSDDELASLAAALQTFKVIIEGAMTGRELKFIYDKTSDESTDRPKGNPIDIPIGKSGLKLTYILVPVGENKYHEYYSKEDIIDIFRDICFSISPYNSFRAIKEVDANVLSLIREHSPLGNEPQASKEIQALNILCEKVGTAEKFSIDDLQKLKEFETLNDTTVNDLKSLANTLKAVIAAYELQYAKKSAAFNAGEYIKTIYDFNNGATVHASAKNAVNDIANRSMSRHYRPYSIFVTILILVFFLCVGSLAVLKDNIQLDRGYELEYSTEYADFSYKKYAEDGQDGIIITKATPTGGVAVEFPSTIDGYAVIAIGENVFGDDAKKVTDVKIPDSVTHIQSNAFSGCTALTTVSFDKNSQLKSIGDSAFSGCSSLEGIDLPGEVTSIGVSAFSGDSGLTSITIPESVTSIGADVFSKCENLTIYCISEGKSDNWETNWHGGRVIVWGVDGEDAQIIEYEKLHFISKNKGNENDEEVLVVIGFSSDEVADSLSIPSEVDGKKVTSIAENAFFGNRSLKEVTVPETIKSIGFAAFSGCTSLESIILPFVGDGTENSTHFGYIFGAEGYGQNKNSLSNIPLKSVEILGGAVTANAFERCNIKTIIFDDGVELIAQNALSGCTVADLTIPFVGNTRDDDPDFDESTAFLGYFFGASSWEDNEEVAEYASDLETLTITGTGKLADHALANCKNLKKVTVYSKYIGDKAFSGCVNLKTINVSDEICGIGYDVFWGCDNLGVNKDSLNVSYIGNDEKLYLILVDGTGFRSSSGEYTTNADTRIIAYNAFLNCKDLKKITITENVVDIGHQAFTCYNLEEIIYCAKKCSDLDTLGSPSLKMPFIAAGFHTGGLNVTFEKTVESIPAWLFFGVLPAKVTSMTIGGNVTRIGDFAFASLGYLEELNYNAQNIIEVGQNAFAFTGSGAEGGYTITFGEGVKSIPANLMNCNIDETSVDTGFSEILQDNPCVTKIVIGDNVTDIGDSAFIDCVFLETVIVGSESRLENIGDYAFSGCSSLTSVTIPDSVTSIGSSAFSGCTSITTATMPALAIDHIPQDNLTTVVITSGESIGSYAFARCRGLTSIAIPDSVTSIGNYAFQYCSGLTSITIPDSVTSIGSYAFDGCSGLTSITIPDSVTSIGNYAFQYCSGLTSITIPDSVTSIGSYAFDGCSSLTSITIPDSVTSIGYHAFYGCTSIETATMPVLAIDDIPQDSLTSVVVTSGAIGYHAFA